MSSQRRTLEWCRQDAGPWWPSGKAIQWSGAFTNQLGHLVPPLGVFIKTSFVFIFSFIYEIWNIWGHFLQYLCSYMLKKSKLNGQILQKRSSNYLKITFPKLNVTKCRYLPSLHFFLTHVRSSHIQKNQSFTGKIVKTIYCSRRSDLPYQKLKIVFKN